ncbi:hypothetical protein H311_03340 [Anncaliia algerae PRA109]|nr:hypothetical protein H311_03340 [Anncaliia algerae PRA109]
MCPCCEKNLIFKECKSFKEGFCWRCHNVECEKYLKRYSVKRESYFGKLDVYIQMVFKVL